MQPILVAAAAALRQNLLPGMVLWLVALAVVLAYYLAPSTRPAYDLIASWKTAGGYLFSGGMSATTGGLIPFLLLLALGRLRPGARWPLLAFMLLFWFERGVEVDALYRFQAWFFGAGADTATVAKKTALDQFLYSACWAAPMSLTLYRWKDCGFSWRATRASMGREFWRVQLPAVVFSNWCVWLPTVSIVYCLPSPLQVPLFNVVLCFWSLLIEAVSARRAAPVPPGAAATV